MPDTVAAASRTVVVVPCYNEAERLDGEQFLDYVRSTDTVDLVLVDDGSTDGTGDLIDALAGAAPERIEALHLPDNVGKAEAVRKGMGLAMARPSTAYAGFWDADLATPLGAVDVFVQTLERIPTIDMVLGARVQLLGRDIERRASRHYLGRVFATVASMVLALPVYDTQCGAKMFRVADNTRELFTEPFRSRWIFDVELIARYLVTHGRASGIFELPLDRWHDVGESKVQGTDFLRAVGEIVQIYRRYRISDQYRALFDLLSAPFLRYSGAGAVGTLFHYLLLTGCVELLDLRPTVGAVVGAFGGALVNYWFNYHFTFVSTRSHGATLPRFLVVAAVGVALNGLIVELMTTRFNTHYLLGQVVATAAVLVVGFVLNRKWTFGKDTSS